MAYFSNSWAACRPGRVYTGSDYACYGEFAPGWRKKRAGYADADRDAYGSGACSPFASQNYTGAASSTWCSVNRAGGAGSVTARIQRQLNIARAAFGLSFAPLVEDGILGSKSDAAIRKYQTWAGLDADGVVGRGTWARLSVYI